jgi:hypothetical protein
VWADLGAFEATVNPTAPRSPNPFDVQALSGGRAWWADAGAKCASDRGRSGAIDWRHAAQ